MKYSQKNVPFQKITFQRMHKIRKKNSFFFWEKVNFIPVKAS